MPDSPVPLGSVEAQVVVHLPESPEVLMISSNDEPMEEPEDHLPVEDDPKEGLDLGVQQVDLL